MYLEECLFGFYGEHNSKIRKGSCRDVTDVKGSCSDVTSDSGLKLSTNFQCLPRETGKGRALEIDPSALEIDPSAQVKIIK